MVHPSTFFDLAFGDS